jgi:putative mRNA 3-end processing factor
VTVRLNDGVTIELATGETFVADASTPDADINFVSHAHGDHLYDAPPGHIRWSETTAQLAARRRDAPTPTMQSDSGAEVELLPSGHIPGSRAALVDDGETTYLYTGDVSTRDRFYLSGFDPVSADVLIIESTYGRPDYSLPPQAEAERAIIEWLNDTMGTPLLLFGYTLRRAQEIQLLAAESAREEIYVSSAIADLNQVIESRTDVSFPVTEYTDESTLTGRDVLVLPSQTTRLQWVDALVNEHNVMKAGFSGWAVDDSYRFRADLDVAFPLSDHCGFDELLDLVEAVAPEKVYTQHGFADEFAKTIRSELGIQAQALKEKQSTLEDF